ncbi:MAG: LPS export ABC transporter permease LptF [Gammaproteobacteria bacterium HGW-Gammaproteobacteria-12]|nr:MAG: LPS export ABC transporter permease LptF [Gammaproteobacteria bacterium HGW-Gammaproteobacteria-12]
MIVFRYLSREVLVTLSAVSAVLLVIIMSGRFIKYLAQAAQGVLDPGVLFLIMGYRIPGFLQLILPLGLFLGFLLAYGRLYLDSEMTVLSATGVSPQRLTVYSMAPALIVALLVGWLSLGLAPQGVASVARILNEQDALTELDTLVPGRVFMSEKRFSTDGTSERGITVLVAESGRQEIQEDGSRYLILENGYRYDGEPGEADYRAIQYDTYGVLLPKPEVAIEASEREATPTRELFGSSDPRMQAELQWRLSLPLLVFIVTLLAVPLSKVNPRQGRFLKLLPAIFLYMAYLGLLIAARGALDKGRLPAALGLWWVHGIFFAIGMLLLYWERLSLWWASRRAPVSEVAHG